MDPQQNKLKKTSNTKRKADRLKTTLKDVGRPPTAKIKYKIKLDHHHIVLEKT